MRRDYFEQFNFQLFETDGSPTQQSTSNELSSKPEPLVIPINVLILPYYPIWHKQIMLSLSFYWFDVSPNLWMWLKLISTRWLRSSRHWSRGSLLINMSVTIYQSTINICLRDYRSTGWIKIPRISIWIPSKSTSVSFKRNLWKLIMTSIFYIIVIALCLLISLIAFWVFKRPKPKTNQNSFEDIPKHESLYLLLMFAV